METCGECFHEIGKMGNIKILVGEISKMLAD